MSLTNLLKSLNIPSQLPIDAKTRCINEATLKDLGENDNLAYTYYKGLKVWCIEERTEYEWKEIEVGDVGLLDTNFTYPNGLIVDGIDYSNKVYNFVLVESDIDLSGVVLTTTDQTIEGLKTFNNTTGFTNGIHINNTATSGSTGLSVTNTNSGSGINVSNTGSLGINLNNQGTGIGLYVNNTSTGKGIVINNSTASTLTLLEGLHQGNSRFSLDSTGLITTNSLKLSTNPTTSVGSYDIITRNSSNSMIEKVSSSIFALDSNVLHKTGIETFSGIKFSTNTTNGSQSAGLSLTNTGSSGATVLKVDNSGSGTGAYFITSSGSAITAINQGTNHLLSLQNDTGVSGVFINNSSSSGTALIANSSNNQATIQTSNSGSNGYAIGASLTGTNSGSAIMANVLTSSTGKLFSGRSNNVETIGITKEGVITANSYNISNLNTAPATSTSTGIVGEIRYTSNYIYVCIALNTWVRSPLTTW